MVDCCPPGLGERKETDTIVNWGLSTLQQRTATFIYSEITARKCTTSRHYTDVPCEGILGSIAPIDIASPHCTTRSLGEETLGYITRIDIAMPCEGILGCITRIDVTARYCRFCTFGGNTGIYHVDRHDRRSTALYCTSVWDIGMDVSPQST